jgi:hypothetical protein
LNEVQAQSDEFEQTALTHQAAVNRASIELGLAVERIGELESDLASGAEARSQLKADLDDAVARLDRAVQQAERAVVERNEIATRDHEDMLELQQQLLNLEVQLNSAPKNSHADFNADRVTIARLEAELAEIRPNAERANSLLAELQAARAEVEERISELTVMQRERDELVGRYDTEMHNTEKDRSNLTRRVAELEKELANLAESAANAEVAQAALAERESLFSRLLSERDEVLWRIAGETAALNSSVAALDSRHAGGQGQLIEVLATLSGLDSDAATSGRRGAVSNPQQPHLDSLGDLLSARSIPDQRSSSGADTAYKRSLAVIRSLVEEVLDRKVPGDLVEVGSVGDEGLILISSILRARHDPARKVWIADAAASVTVDNVIHYPVDRAGGVEAERAKPGVRNLAAFNATDGMVGFIDGTSEEALLEAGIVRFAFIHLHVDSHNALSELDNLYSRLSPGGCMYVSSARPNDRDGLLKALVHQFGVARRIREVEGAGFCWTRESAEKAKSKTSIKPKLLQDAVRPAKNRRRTL